MKDSLAGRMLPTMNVMEDQIHLKARRCKVDSVQIYRFEKIKWNEYSMFEKAKVHKEINAQIKFDLPINHKRVDKYLG